MAPSATAQRRQRLLHSSMSTSLEVGAKYQLLPGQCTALFLGILATTTHSDQHMEQCVPMTLSGTLVATKGNAGAAAKTAMMTRFEMSIGTRPIFRTI